VPKGGIAEKLAWIDQGTARCAEAAATGRGDGNRKADLMTSFHRLDTRPPHTFVKASLLMAALAGALTGFGCGKDDPLEVTRTREAAAHGETDAQIALANMYDRGQGVAENLSEAVNLYRKAAEHGNSDAQANLGRMYSTGRGIAQDFAMAVHWFRKAADQGNPLGQNRLGEAYHDGKGVPQDFTEAVKWYRKAAEQGNGAAQFHLGESYRDGEGVDVDLVEAHRWMNVSAAHTPDDYTSALSFARARDQLAKKMTAEQVVQAQKRAREWVDRFAGMEKLSQKQ